jgi:hypothetical protein
MEYGPTDNEIIDTLEDNLEDNRRTIKNLKNLPIPEDIEARIDEIKKERQDLHIKQGFEDRQKPGFYDRLFDQKNEFELEKLYAEERKLTGHLILSDIENSKNSANPRLFDVAHNIFKTLAPWEAKKFRHDIVIELNLKLMKAVSNGDEKTRDRIVEDSDAIEKAYTEATGIDGRTGEKTEKPKKYTRTPPIDYYHKWMEDNDK